MTKSESPVMYLGPTIRGVVKYGAVFSGGIPKRLEKLAGKKPIVKQLIVPLSDIVKTKTAIDNEGTVEAVAYDKIEALSEAEVKKITEGE